MSVVTDEMVWVACDAYGDIETRCGTKGMRRALEAVAEKLQPAAQGESVGRLTISRFRGSDAMVNHDFDYHGDLPDGSYSLYTHPAAECVVDDQRSESDSAEEIAQWLHASGHRKASETIRNQLDVRNARIAELEAERVGVPDDLLESLRNEGVVIGDRIYYPERKLRAILASKGARE